MNLFLASLLIGLNVHAQEFSISPEIYRGETVELITYRGPNKFDTYLAMNLPFAPALRLYQQVQTSSGLKLKTRNEAHITVITPVEYFDVLRLVDITADEIDEIARKNLIQSSKFEIICLGQGSVMLNAKLEKTFYVVVQSDDLLKIRKEIKELYLAKIGLNKSGAPEAFNEAHYYPHITLGYTDRDLHEEGDKVIKDDLSCISDIGVK